MKISVITGQTATGKTKLSLAVAKRMNADIINFDSRQAYKYLNIITGKDLEKPEFHKTGSVNGFDIGYYLIRDVKVWLYDIVDPKAYFSSFDFVSCGQFVLDLLAQQGKNAVLTGGTYLYLYHLLYKVDTERIPPDFTLRNTLNSQPLDRLQRLLKKTDASLFKRLNNSEKNNPQRLIRKIEIARHYKKRGKSVPNAMKHIYNERFKNMITEFVGLQFENRDDVRKRISDRVMKRMKEGAIAEVHSLLKKGYDGNDPGMKTVGHQELIQFIKGKVTLEQAIVQWINHEVQYSKRQLTFMKKDPHIRWNYIL